MKNLISTFAILGVLISLSIHSLNAQVSYTSCTNDGINSSALGNNSITSGNYSFAFGYYTKATAYNSFSFGSGIDNSGGKVAYLLNDKPNSFLIGFSNIPVLFAQLRSSTDAYSNDLRRVGIGTNSPKTALDVEGTIRTQNLRILNHIRYTGSSLTIGYQSEIDELSIQEPLLTLKDGKVGIRNLNPTVVLDVSGGMKVQSFETNSIRVGGDIEFTQSVLSFIRVSNNRGDSIMFDPEPNIKEPERLSTYIMTLKGTDVGIGIQNPEAKLHVLGNAAVNGKLRLNSSANYEEADIAIKNKWFFTSGTSNVIGHNWRTNPNNTMDMPRAQSGTASAIFFDGSGNIRFRVAPHGTANSNITSWEELIMTNDGDVGIGITNGNPKQKLHVAGNTYITNNLGIGVETTKTKFQIGNIWTFHDGSNDKIIGRNCYYDNGSGKNKFIQNGIASRMYFGGNGDIVFQTAESGTGGSVIDGKWKSIYIKNNGDFGIGIIPQKKFHVDGESYFTNRVSIGGLSDNNNYILAVNGIVGCKEVVVEISSWYDHVFESDYDLKTLSEVESFIKENKHLPDIPSAENVLENGIGLSEMNALLLKKVEELTLYIIEQEKRIQSLENNCERRK